MRPLPPGLKYRLGRPVDARAHVFCSSGCSRNVPTHSIDGAPEEEAATYCDASSYLQKTSVTDVNGHKSM